MDLFLYIIIFIMGTVFGSFLTLSTYRLPLNQDILHKRSYCPRCNHELSFFDMIPVLSYVFLRGKCRYCKNKISPRYVIIEILCGISFIILSLGLGINVNNLYTLKGIEFGLGILYIVFLFLIGGIDKEHVSIHKGVLMYGIIISALNFIYHYLVDGIFNINTLIIYLVLIAVLVIMSTYKLKKKAKDDYNIELVIVSIIMNFFGGEVVTIITIIYTLLAIAINTLINKIINKGKKYNKRIPIAFYMCIINALVWVIMFLSLI